MSSRPSWPTVTFSEAALWAEAYLLLGALDTPAGAMLFSIDSMTTRGASGLTLHQHWQEMGALEGVVGVLMFGISTAYMFFVMQLYLPEIHAIRSGRSPHWLKMKNPAAPAVKREMEEDWGR